MTRTNETGTVPSFRDDRLIQSSVQTVEDAWIDYNGHLNMAYYNVLFDRGVDEAFLEFGLGPDYVKSHNASFFTLEAHTTYLGEIGRGDKVVATLQMLDWDHKRVHYFEELYRLEDGLLSATSEQIAMHVDMSTRRSSPFPDNVQSLIAQTMDQHINIPHPSQVGHVIGIPKPKHQS